MSKGQIDPLSHAASLSSNALLAAASGEVVGGSFCTLRRGEQLKTNQGVVWFPLDAVVRAETADGLLEGWIDRHGAVGLLDLLDGPQTGTVWIVERTGRALVAPSVLVQAMLYRSIEFQRAVMAWLVRSEHAARRRAAFNLTASAPEKVRRVVDFILSYHDDFAPITQEQVATYTGIQRTTVCAAMRTMQAEGMIVFRRGKIRRPDSYGHLPDKAQAPSEPL